ncbi:hypothetical protein [Wolbachia endosymbiont of Leptopilina clavipes]|uniref:hypothetical protein n=1 Tax=Wolbachia endosymbiont of Leptopilina clavipes TaxID=260213 RepID=UPI0015CFE07A|nr:hypothetical protein [Wolbachia endosymbiont of Leptopilina clavipes]
MNSNDGLLKINSLGRKNDKCEYELIHEYEKKLKTLGLDSEENDDKELIITLVPSSIVKSSKVEQQEEGKSLKIKYKRGRLNKSALHFLVLGYLSLL